MRARLALYFCQIKVEIREVLLKDKPASLLMLSPKATVPVMLLNDGSVIEESYEIMQWAVQQQDTGNLFKRLTEQQKLSAEQLIACNDQQFKKHLDKYKYADRYPQFSADKYRQDGEVFIAELERCLGQKNYLLDNQLSIADLAILPFIRQFASVDRTWFDNSEYRAVKRWLDNFLNSKPFIDCMMKLSPWQHGDTPLYFP